MPTDQVKRINLNKIYPPLLERLLDILAACNKRGEQYYVVQGYRSHKEQKFIYDQGRTTPGPRAGEPGHPVLGYTVTKAPPGASAHNYGLAVDVCCDADRVAPGLQPVWAEGRYAVFGEEGRRRGLQVGVPGLRDFGHLQWPLSLVLSPDVARHGDEGGTELRSERKVLTRMRRIMAQDETRLRAVWNLVDREYALPAYTRDPTLP